MSSYNTWIDRTIVLLPRILLSNSNDETLIGGRVYALVELDGSVLVSMEYVDGTTLLEVLREKAPLHTRRSTSCWPS